MNHHGHGISKINALPQPETAFKHLSIEVGVFEWQGNLWDFSASLFQDGFLMTDTVIEDFQGGWEIVTL